MSLTYWSIFLSYLCVFYYKMAWRLSGQLFRGRKICRTEIKTTINLAFIHQVECPFLYVGLYWLGISSMINDHYVSGNYLCCAIMLHCFWTFNTHWDFCDDGGFASPAVVPRYCRFLKDACMQGSVKRSTPGWSVLLTYSARTTKLSKIAKLHYWLHIILQ